MITRFRSGIVMSAPRIDREKSVMHGISVLEVGEAKGHGLLIDATTLAQAVERGNAVKGGLMSRFTHPGACDDATGKRLGRVRELRVEGNRVVGDLHLAAFSAKSPDGDLREYVMARAEEEPDGFGMSIVFSGKPVWALANGTEVNAFTDTGAKVNRPADATSDKPLARVEILRAADVVDEPAATSGMFSGTTGEAAAEAFEMFDQIRERNGMSLADASAFVGRYFAARGYIAAGEVEGKQDELFSDKSNEAAKPAERKHMTPEQLKALSEAHPAHAGLILSAFVAGKAEAEIISAIKDAELAAANERATALSAEVAKAAEAHKAQLAAVQKEADDAKAALAKAQKEGAFNAGFAADPGSDHNPAEMSDETALKKEWEASSPAKKTSYFNSYEIFADAKKLEAKDRLHAAKGE